MVAGEKLYTYAEYEDYVRQSPNTLLELIDGKIVEKMTSESHGSIALTIGVELRNWQKRNNIKGISGVEITHRNRDDNYNARIPDVSFRYTTDKPQQTAAPVIPDFAVEIKSRSNTFKELREKAEFYIANGARLVWLVYPTKEIVEVYFADGTIDIFKGDDVLSGGDVLQGFQMTVAEVFES